MDLVDRYVHKSQPYKHQVDYLRAAVGRHAFACYAEMGCGKSKMLIDEIAILRDRGQVDFVLVTTKKGNYRNWVQELRKHLPDRIRAVVHTWSGGDTMTSRRERREFLASLDDGRLRILLVNIEALAASRTAQNFAMQCYGKFRQRMTIVDESTLIKNPDAIRTRFMVKLASVSEYRRIATGNPTPNGTLDLWGQFLFLGQGSCEQLLGFRSFFAFRARYCVMETKYIGASRTVQEVVSYRNTAEIRERVQRHSFRVRKEDCLDLPPKVYEPREVELTKEQREAYEEMRRTCVAELDDTETVTAAHVMAQMIKLQQIACGLVETDDGVMFQLPSNRLSELDEVIEESSGGMIIWCAFRANVQAVVEHLVKVHGRGQVVEYWGATRDQDRQTAIERFQSGEARFFVGTPHAGGMGLTLTAAKTVVYFSNTWDLELRAQSEDRAHRIGQTSSVTYVDLISPGTIDEKIVRALREKIDLATQIMGDRWREWVV